MLWGAQTAYVVCSYLFLFETIVIKIYQLTLEVFRFMDISISSMWLDYCLLLFICNNFRGIRFIDVSRHFINVVRLLPPATYLCSVFVLRYSTSGGDGDNIQLRFSIWGWGGVNIVFNQQASGVICMRHLFLISRYIYCKSLSKLLNIPLLKSCVGM